MTVVVRQAIAAVMAPAVIARHAVASLHAELVLAPKPGLVCPDDRGSHDDMDASTMMRSLVALRHGFVAMAIAGAEGAAFDRLQAIGLEAERAMRLATGGVNTHRGAIFTLGLLVASAANLAAQDATHRAARHERITAAMLQTTLQDRWGKALRMRPVDEASHGLAMAARYRAGGARREAAEGFPGVFDVVLPALRAARAAGHDERAARLQALMTSIARVEDTNLLYRGGRDGLCDAQAAARTFLAEGGVANPDHDAMLRVIGHRFVARRLSPGGSADLLAAALFVDRVVEAA